MPFTPFHFGAHACVALALQRCTLAKRSTKCAPLRGLDVPVFILASVVIDVEPLLVILFDLHYPLHGYLHTFLGSFLVGSLWGGVAYMLRKPVSTIMKFLRLPYSPSLRMSILSGALGGCMHVLFDAPIYTDIMPLYPLGDLYTDIVNFV